MIENLEKSKLVRDMTPDLLKISGKKVVTHIADDKEFYDMLKKKLSEEVNEFIDDEGIKELADIMEVILAICEYNNFGFEEIEAIRQQKALEKGTFDKRIILDSVE